jgi:hypothetical protein
MLSSVESARHVSAWQQNESLVNELKKEQLIRDTLASVREQMDQARQEMLDLEQQHVEERAREIVSGDKNRERNDRLVSGLIEAREKLKNLQFEEQSLVLAEKTVGSSVRKLESQAKSEARQRIVAAYQKEARKMRTLALQVQEANDAVIQLDKELRASGLADGTKQLLLIARTGLAWSAVSPLPIMGGPVHLVDWLSRVDQLLGE